VVLLDMTLPGMSGPEIFSQLQVIRPGVKVIFTTAYSQQTLASAVSGGESFGFLRKPYHLADLLELLRDANLTAKV
jgi:two-component system, cell cycle sensor histidine kinase and response regulator CckA